MLNPSNLFDLNIGWALSHDQFMRNGDVWVGITAKPITVAALKTFDPARYGSLSFANPLPLSDPANCTAIQTSVDPPELRSRLTEDGLVWDINSQVGAWLKSGARSNPLDYGRGRSQVEKAYGFGYSQTGGYLVDYINAIHPRVVAEDGKPIYDGYLVGVAGGNFVGAVPLNQCEPAPRNADPRLQIRDAGVPVIRIMSQSDYLLGITARREDGNTPRGPLPPLRDGRRRARDAGRALLLGRARRTSCGPAAPCRPRPATRARAAASRARSTSTPGCATSTCGRATGSRRRPGGRSTWSTAPRCSTRTAT